MRHERYIKNENNTAHISLLLLEFPLKSSDSYRISPNIPQTLCHPSKGEIVPHNLRYLIACNSVFFCSDAFETYAKTSLELSAACDNEITALHRNAVYI